MSDSTHFTWHKLYTVIRDNDVEGVERGIFFLGAKIHVAQIWNKRTPLEYAARLGHMEQVNILLTDFEKYFDNTGARTDYKPKGKLGSLVRELIPHRAKDPELMKKLIDTYEEECVEELEEMISADAFDLVGVLAKKNKQKYIPEIIRYCYAKMKTQLFDMPDWFVKDPKFVQDVQNRERRDQLEAAIIKKDCEKFVKLLQDVAEGTVRDFPCTRKIANPRPIHKRGDMDGFGEHIRTPEFFSMVAKTDCVPLLKKLIEPKMVQHVLKIARLPEDKMFRSLFSSALCNEAIDNVDVLLKDERFDKDFPNWHHLYYDLLQIGKFKAAEIARSQFIGGRIENRNRGRLYHLFGNEKPILESTYLEDAPAELIKDIVAAIDSFPRNLPKPGSKWRKCVNSFPLSKGRPDLIERFTRYGAMGTEESIVYSICGTSGTKMRERNRWDTEGQGINILLESFTSSDLAYVFFGETNPPLPIELSAPLELTAIQAKRLTDCVVQTAKQVKLEVFSDEDDEDDDFDIEDENLELVQDMEVKRVESLSLKKLCRLKIRQQATLANKGKSMTDALLTLYVENQLPKSLANYLIYRDENLSQPLYYKLLKPSHSSQYRNHHGQYSDDEDYDVEDYLEDLNLYGGYPGMFDSESSDDDKMWKVYAKYYPDCLPDGCFGYGMDDYY